MFWKTEIDFLAYISILLFSYWLFVFLGSLVKQSNLRLIYLLFGSVLFSFFFSLRSPEIGSDAANYALLVTSPGELNQAIEPFFIFLAFLVRKLGGNEYIYFFLISLLINASLITAYFNFSEEKFHFYYLFFITSFLFINMNMNIMRQGVAISIATLALSYFFQKKILNFFLFTFLAILTHLSSIIFLLIPVLWSLKLRPKQITVLSLGLVGLYFIKLSTLIQPLVQYGFFFDKLYWYLTWDKVMPFKIKHVYFLLMILFLIALVVHFKNVENRKWKMGFYSLLSILFVSSVFREDEFLVDRSAFYFFPVVAMITFDIFEIFKLKTNKQLVLNILIFGSLIWMGQALFQYYSWWILGNIR